MPFIEVIRTDWEYYITVALIAVPFARILMRAGFTPLWVVLLAIPDAGVVLFALLLALRKWPQMKGA